jgi:hypothetical protein
MSALKHKFNILSSFITQITVSYTKSIWFYTGNHKLFVNSYNRVQLCQDGKMQNFLMLELVVHVVTIVPYKGYLISACAVFT